MIRRREDVDMKKERKLLACDSSVYNNYGVTVFLKPLFLSFIHLINLNVLKFSQ